MFLYHHRHQQLKLDITPVLFCHGRGQSIHQVNWVEKFARGVIDEHKLDVSQLFTGFALNARQYL
mgnify:CR=1 FL=1